MMNMFKKALLMALLAFLCGMQGHAVKLNSKGQKMVKRIIKIDPSSQKETGWVVFKYHKNNTLSTITVTLDGDKKEYTIHRTQDSFTVKYCKGGIEVPNYKYTVSVNENGNIETLCSSCIGDDGSMLSDMVKCEYLYNEDDKEYHIREVTSWTQYTDTKGATRSANNDNEHVKAFWYYIDGNIYFETKHYIYDRELPINPNGYGGHTYSENKIDDTNMNLGSIIGGFGDVDPLNVLSFTEWLPYKTHNLVIGMSGGEGNDPVKNYKYGYDDDGNIVSIYENNVRWGRWRSNGFVETYRIEYVE